ncbi:MAG TPA: lamin tail domain-containing protein, partial [Chthoniobacteraceae bacterium]|nr:lamin tail domain-containing protein [Chthoniobacteraceae bacterium]
VYFTTDGTDPRQVGGAVGGQVYSAPVSVNQSTIIKARVLNGTTWSPLMEGIFTVTQPLPLQLTEIMYNPLGQGAIDSDEFEFIELKNTGSQTLALNGMQFTDGIAFTFPPGATLAAGAFAILAKNPTQFNVRYPGVTVAGSYSSGGNISNSGELLTLRDIVGNPVLSVSFLDYSPWPSSPDGYGNSLVPVNPNANPSPNDPVNWRASAMIHGSPGQDDPAPTLPGVLVNEVLTNPVSGDSDAIELYNPTAQTADVSGWFITDASVSPKKFKIRAGAVIPASGFLVLRAADFSPGPGFTAAFSLSSDKGEVRLYSADVNDNLTGYSHGYGFSAAAPGVTFGRYVNAAGQEKFPPQSVPTLGAANAGPLVGPVAVTELMYNPATGGDEYMEIRNVTGESVPLFDPENPTNTWRVTGLGSGGTDWAIPEGVTLQPRGFAILTEIDPSVFRIKYNTPLSIPVFRYTGALDNAGEKVSLLRPGVPYLNAVNVSTVPFIEADSVEYSPNTPWPTTPNGSGPALERIDWRAYGNDPVNWRASAAGGNPGAVAPGTFSDWQTLYFTSAEINDPTKGAPGADPDGDGWNNLTECALGLDPLRPDYTGVLGTSIEMDGSGGPYLMLHYRRSLSAQGFQWLVDTAAAPNAWQLGASVPVGTPVNNGDGTETVSQRDTVPADGLPERLIRLRIIGN